MGMFADVFDSLPLQYEGVDDGKQQNGPLLAQEARGQQTQPDELRVDRGVRRGAGVLDGAPGPDLGYDGPTERELDRPLDGQPGAVDVPGRGEVVFGPFRATHCGGTTALAIGQSQQVPPQLRQLAAFTLI